MKDVSTEELVGRLRESLCALLRWAEAYQPRMVYERGRYDADLDEAENVLAATDAWIGDDADQWQVVQPREMPDRDE